MGRSSDADARVPIRLARSSRSPRRNFPAFLSVPSASSVRDPGLGRRGQPRHAGFAVRARGRRRSIPLAVDVRDSRIAVGAPSVGFVKFVVPKPALEPLMGRLSDADARGHAARTEETEVDGAAVLPVAAPASFCEKAGAVKAGIRRRRIRTCRGDPDTGSGTCRWHRP